MESHDGIEAEAHVLSESLSARANASLLPDSVLRSVTRELVNRLARDHGPVAAGGPTVLEETDPDEIDRFCDALTHPSAERSQRFFDAVQRQGKTTDTMCLRYIAPAARSLGERWVRDDCSFLEVTLGTARLHALQRSLRGNFIPANLNQSPDLTALFTVTPGDSHVLGVTMAADFFRRAGWLVDLNTSPEIEALLAQASLSTYAVIGVSVGAYPDDGRLEETVERLRALQPAAKVVLGGRIADLEPDLVERIGADAVIEDVTSAPFSLQTMINSAFNV